MAEPGSFGVEGLTRKLNEALKEIKHLRQDMVAGLACLERKVDTVGANLDTLADLVAAARGDAAAERTEVNNKLDEMNAKIAELMANSNDPVKIQQLATDLESLRGEIQGTFTGNAP